MHNDSIPRLVAMMFGLFLAGLLVNGTTGYVAPARAQRPEQAPVIVIATPRLPAATPTEVPQPTIVPTEAPPQPTPEPVVIIQYVPIEAVPPTVPPPPIEPRGETIIQIDPVPERGQLGGRRNDNDGKADHPLGGMPEAVGP